MVVTLGQQYHVGEKPTVILYGTGKMDISQFAFAPENSVSRNGFDSPVPRQPAHLHTQAESDAYSRDFSRFPRRRLFICLNPDTPSGQCRDSHAAQLRTDGIHCREYAGTGPVVLKVVAVTGATPWQVTMDQYISR